MDLDGAPVRPGDDSLGEIADTDAIVETKRRVDTDGDAGKDVSQCALQGQPEHDGEHA